ncbi:radical SAM protein [Elusimicrobiota bacterium]
MNICTLFKSLYLRRQFPPNIVFFVTSRCSMKCRTCFYRNKMNNSSVNNELSIDEIENIAKKYKNAFLLSLSGGEPFMRDDLADICVLFNKYSNTRYIDIPTNASDPDKISQIVRDILERSSGLYLQIDLSLDGIGELHDTIRGCSGSYELLIKTYDMLSTLKNRHDNLKIKINTTFSHFNQASIIGMCEDISMIFPSIDFFSINYIHGRPFDIKAADVDPRIFKEVSKKLDRAARSAGNFTDKLIFTVQKLTREIIYDTVISEKSVLQCRALKKLLVIDETGEVFPCEPFFDKKLGNLRDNDYDIRKILDSRTAKDFYKNHLESGECFCNWGCAATNNIIFNPKGLAKLLDRFLNVKKRLPSPAKPVS